MVNKAKRYHEKENAKTQDHLDDIEANAGRTGSIDQMILFAAGQNRTIQERWEAVQASRTPRRLRMVIGMKERNAVDSYFQAIRNKAGSDKSIIMPHGNGSFPPSSKDEDSVPTRSKKAFLGEKCCGAQNKQKLPLLPKEQSCAGDREWKSTGEQHIPGPA